MKFFKPKVEQPEKKQDKPMDIFKKMINNKEIVSVFHLEEAVRDARSKNPEVMP